MCVEIGRGSHDGPDYPEVNRNSSRVDFLHLVFSIRGGWRKLSEGIYVVASVTILSLPPRH